MQAHPADTKPRTPAKLNTGYLALATGVLGTSAASLFYKLSFATGLHPLWVNALRLLITLLLMAPLTFASRKRREALMGTLAPKPEQKAQPAAATLGRRVKRMWASRQGFWISALSGTLLALHFTAWALALEHTDVFAASAIWGTYLLMTAALSVWLLHEKTSRGTLTGMVIATVGVLVCNMDGGPGKLGGNLLALLAALLQALYTLCGRKARAYLDTNTYTSIVYTFTFFWMAVILLLFRIRPTGFQAQNLLWAAGLAVFATLLGHTMLSVSLKYFKAPTVSAVMLITVGTAPLPVLLVLGDAPTAHTLIGGCIILLGLAWYLWMEHRERAALQKAEA